MIKVFMNFIEKQEIRRLMNLKLSFAPKLSNLLRFLRHSTIVVLQNLNF